MTRVQEDTRAVWIPFWVDQARQDLRFAFRTFRRAPLAALTIIATVALGLGLITVVFTVYNMFFLRVDAVRNPGELFKVERATGPGEREAGPDGNIGPPFTRPDYEAMRRDTTVFTDIVAMIRPVRTRIDGRLVNSQLVTGNFFQSMGVQAALGRTLTPEDDDPSDPRPVIVLSHRGWNQLFAGDPAVIGRSLPVNGMPYEVVGVMPDSFRGLAMGPPAYWAPLALARQFRHGNDEIAVDVVGRLKPGISPEAAIAALNVWTSAQTNLQAGAARQMSVRLIPSQGTVSADVTEALLVFSPLFFAFGLILMIGCANVANLQLARGMSRQREIGIRVALGASRGRVIRQLLTESLLLALAAAACGFAVSRLFMNGVVYAATTTMPPEIAENVTVGVPASDWRVLVFLVAGAVVSTVLFGLAPALQTTRLEVVRTIRGEVLRDARPGRARQALIALQVGASALLVICAAIFLRGALAAATVDPGVRTRDTLRVSITDEPRRAALLQAVMTHPLVVTAAASTPEMRTVATPAFSGADGREQASRIPVDQRAVSSGYFDLLDIDLVSGRSFAEAERSAEAGVTVVSESVAHRLWPNRTAVGQVVNLELAQSDSPGDLSPPRAFTVVGVVRDVTSNLRLIDAFGFRGVYLPTSPEHSGTFLMVRVRGDPEQARQALVESLTTVHPGLGDINTLRAIAGVPVYILRIAFWVAVVLGGLAIALTASGLFSVLSYLVEQRAKEIGVRMALGATMKNVAALVLSQSLRPVGIGLVAGGGLAAALAMALTSAISEIGSIVHVFDPVAYVASVLCIVTACALAALIPALRAARIDPIASLRQD